MSPGYPSCVPYEAHWRQGLLWVEGTRETAREWRAAESGTMVMSQHLQGLIVLHVLTIFILTTVLHSGLLLCLIYIWGN